MYSFFAIDPHTGRRWLRVCACLIICALFHLTTPAQNIQHSKSSQDLGLRHDFSVDPVSLSLNLQITLGGYKGRGGSAMPVTLRYSSKLWRLDFDEYVVGGPVGLPDDNNYTKLNAVYGDPNHDRMTPGWSSTLEMPYLINDPEWFTILGEPCEFNKCGETGTDNNKIMRVRLHMPDGSTHELRADDNTHPSTYNPYPITFYAVDGSQLVYKVLGVVNGSEQSVTYLPDGSRYLSSNNGFTGSFVDRHGNTLTFDGTSWTDALGRSVSLSDTPGFNNTTTHVNYEYRQLKVANHPEQSALTNFEDVLGTYGTWDGNTNNSPGLFGSGSAADRINSGGIFNPSVLYRITYADGSAYTFTYNIYGEIDKIVYPTGCYERFEYGAVPGVTAMNEPYTSTNRGVKRRFVSPDGSAASEQEWDYEAVEVSSSVLKTVVVAPDNTVTERFVHRGLLPGVKYFDFDDARAGMVFEERLYAPGGERGQKGVVLRRKLTKWGYDQYVRQGIVAGGYVVTSKPRMTREVEVTFDPGNDVLTKSTNYGYDADLNVTLSEEYGFARMTRTSAQANEGQISAIDSFPQGSLLRKSQTNYLVNESDSVIASSVRAEYRARNLVSLPTSSTVKDGAGNDVSRTVTRYDESAYPVISCAGIEGWTDPQTYARGDATTSKAWVNTNNTWVETHAQYDQAGNVRESRDSHLDTDASHGRVTEYAYTTAYQYTYLEETRSPVPDSTGAKGSTARLVSSSTYDVKTGLATTATDAAGLITHFYYTDELGQPDPLSRLRKVERPGGGWTSYEYGNTPFNFYARTRTAIDASRATDSYQFFDGLGRPSRTYTFDGSTPDRTWVAAKTTYDNMGRAAGVSYPQFRATTDDFTAAGVTTTEYDYFGRVTKSTTPDGAHISTSYDDHLSASLDGRRVTVTDQATKARSKVYDALGRLVMVTEAPGVAGYGYETAYEYDLLGNLTKIVQGKAGQTQQTRTFSYDSLSRLKTAVNPESGTATYEYDPVGNLKKKVDARHVQTDYTYDALNRITLRAYSIEQGHTTPDNYVAAPNVSYFYDGTGMPYDTGAQSPTPLPTPERSTGKMTAVKSSASVTAYTEFDAAGRVSKHRQLSAPDTAAERAYKLEYTYDLGGNLIAEKYPSGKTVTTEYDSAGRVAGVKRESTGAYYAGGAASDAALRIRYAAHGAAEAVRLGNGLWEHTAFNSRLRPEQIGLGTSATDSGKLHLTYGYGPAGQDNGNVTSQRIEAAGVDQTQTYQYDEVNRLLSAREAPTAGGADSWRQAYTYTESAGQNGQFGNRRINTGNDPVSGQPLTTANVTPLSNPSAEPTTNRFASNQGYSYDAAGNLRQDPSHTYSYDGENRMAAADGGWNGVAGASYLYDGDGHRVGKVTAGESTVFVYDEAGLLVAEYSNRVELNGTLYLTQDSLGSTRAVTDSLGNANSVNGAKGSMHDYLPFGEEVGAGVGGRAITGGYVADNVRKKFTGHERDPETGLDFAQARYYSSAQGRFTSPDDFSKDSDTADPQSWNKYSYVRNNPLKYIDPTGEKADVTITTDERNKTGTITIKATIGIWTNDPNISKADLDEAAKNIQKSIKDGWSGTFVKDGTTFTVKVDVTVQAYLSAAAATYSGNQNVIEMVNGQADTANSRSGKFPGGTEQSPDGGKWNLKEVLWRQQPTQEPAHEFGHLLGVDGHPDDHGTVQHLMRMGNDMALKADAVDYNRVFGAAIAGHNFRLDNLARMKSLDPRPGVHTTNTTLRAVR